ncbi:MAG: hypothetical protein EZS28_025415, partial [Streblomastix strix]
TIRVCAIASPFLNAT